MRCRYTVLQTGHFFCRWSYSLAAKGWPRLLSQIEGSFVAIWSLYEMNRPYWSVQHQFSESYWKSSHEHLQSKIRIGIHSILAESLEFLLNITRDKHTKPKSKKGQSSHETTLVAFVQNAHFTQSAVIAFNLFAFAIYSFLARQPRAPAHRPQMLALVVQEKDPKAHHWISLRDAMCALLPLAEGREHLPKVLLEIVYGPDHREQTYTSFQRGWCQGLQADIRAWSHLQFEQRTFRNVLKRVKTIASERK